MPRDYRKCLISSIPCDIYIPHVASGDGLDNAELNKECTPNCKSNLIQNLSFPRQINNQLFHTNMPRSGNGTWNGEFFTFVFVSFDFIIVMHILASKLKQVKQTF